MWRLLCILIGYFPGCFLMAEAVVRKQKHTSVFEIGTGNPGMANVMAQCGFMPGLAVLAGDAAKTVLVCVFCRFLLFPQAGAAAAAWAGLGCVLGHDFPFWHHFRGGKGVSCTCLAIFVIHPAAGLLAMIISMFFVFLTQYLPVGAVLIPAAFVPMAYLLYGKETAAVAVLMTVLMFCRHFPGLKNIPSGTEPRVNVAQLLNRKFGWAAGGIATAVASLIAIALIYVLCGPWYRQYVSQQKQETCVRARQDGCYAWDTEMGKQEAAGEKPDADTQKALLYKIFEERYGQTIGADGTMTGVCRAGGTYRISYDPDTATVTITCSCDNHGTYVWKRGSWGSIVEP